MTKFKAVIFDADGVLVQPQMVFSKQYAKEKGLNPDSFTQFFKGEFEEALCGKADLKELILKYNDIWHCAGDPQAVLDAWFAAEHNLDSEAMDVVMQLNNNGLPIYLATNQEEYRATYMREKMFPGVFRQIFASSGVGYTKKDVRFWEKVIEVISADIPGILSSEIIFFDDSQDSVDGACKAGVDARLYSHVDQLRSF